MRKRKRFRFRQLCFRPLLSGRFSVSEGDPAGVPFLLCNTFLFSGKERGTVIQGLDYLRELNTVSVLLRLTLAMFCGGMIGLEIGRAHV